ncbi:MAG: phosphatidate cytidylyltransferase [Chitinophagaceae bacterium]
MALNLQTLRTRSLTAAIYALVMLAGIFTGPWSFFLLFTFIHFGCWYEYQKLLAKIDPGYLQISPLHKYGFQLAGWCMMLFATNDYFHFNALYLHQLGFYIGLTLVFVLPLVEFLFSKELSLKNFGYSAFGLLYISLSWSLMISLRTYNMITDSDRGWVYPALLIFSIWINDTMAYIVGSLIGKTPFSPISPKKTWEGTIGGAILCCLVIGFAGSRLLDVPVKAAFVIAAIAAILGTIGDLLESKFKRMALVKDSGSIMPGHGGFLDRFDSLLLATPFAWIYAWYFLG